MNDYEMMYTELKEALVGDSPYWTHEELVVLVIKLIDKAGVYRRDKVGV